MLSATHDRAYQDFLTLLTRFSQLMSAQQQKIDLIGVAQQFEELAIYFETHILPLDCTGIASEFCSRWQSIQREILREYKLLSIDKIFLSSARQQTTQNARIKNISDRLTKLIGYCQIMLKDNN